MNRLYVIVHPDSCKAYIGSEDAKKALFEIERIKSSESYLIIRSIEQPYQLHRDMPEPSENLEVIVCGGFKHTCVTMQLFNLREEGYNARFHPFACCPGQGRLPFTMLKEIDERYPDFDVPATI